MEQARITRTRVVKVVHARTVVRGGGGGGGGTAGVSSFNNRTGAVTLTANDVSAVADVLYAKESNLTYINMGDGKVPADTQRMGPSGNFRWDLYGIVANQTKTHPSNGTEISYIGLHTNANVDRPYIGKWFKDAATGKETQVALYMDYGVNFHSSVWHANYTQESQVYFFTTVFGLTFGMESTDQFCSFDMNLRDGLMVYGTVKAFTNYNPEPFELLNTQVADRRYEPIVRRN